MSNNSKEGIKWYSLNNILKHEAQYYIIFGERSNGKSFAVDKYLIDKYFEDGSQFGFVKRFEEDIKGKYMSEVFSSELQDYMLEKYGYKMKFYRGQWLVYKDGEDGKPSECEVFGYAFSLSNVNRTKATSYPKINTILFEEFMSIDCSYLPDELSLLLNLVSTIVRYRHNVKVFMLANAISKFSPYSQALGIRLHRLKKGEIIEKEFKDSKGFRTKFVIERTENVNVFDNDSNKEKVVYNVFGDSGVGKMITTGDFETHRYKRILEGVSFADCNLDCDYIMNKDDKSKIVIRYEDYYYRIYMTWRHKWVLGFREIDYNSISANNTRYILNGNTFIKGVSNISNTAIYRDGIIDGYLDIIVQCMRMQDFITLSDDDGENVVNAFRLTGIPISI